MQLLGNPSIALLSVAASGIHQLETVFLLLLALVVVFALLARGLKTPYPIVLVVGGLLLSFIPGIPRVTLTPDIVFLVVLPPLLYHAAWHTSWREFRFNLVSIALLAFGLVSFTVWGVSVLTPHLFAGFDWRLGFVLGAVVATTDAIAATSIANQIGLPGRIVDVLEGESLLNDATGLLALEFAIALLLSGQTPSVASGFLRLTWLTFGGIGVGLLVAFVADRFERRLEYASLEIVLSLLIPYGTYLAAEYLHSSGVLAVVACGLFLSRRSPEFFSPTTRLQASAVWESLNFALNGLTFILIGLQLPSILSGIDRLSLPSLLLKGALFTGFLILLRLVWVFPGAYLATWVRRRLFHHSLEWPPVRQLFVVGWTGMRGVIALAAALSLPITLSDGTPFPQRNLIVFLAFCVILITLVLQGLTLPLLIRFLGLAESGDSDKEECKARAAVLKAALAHLEAARKDDLPEWSKVYDHLASHYRTRLNEVQSNDDRDKKGETADYLAKYRQVAQDLLNVERETALRFRTQGRISDGVLRQLEREFDLAELGR